MDGYQTMNRENLRLLPNRENHYCFGCSPLNSSGLAMEFHTDGAKVFSWLTVPGHLCGWHNLAHGGILSTILDETMGWCAMHSLKRITLTKAMEVRFFKPVRVLEPLTAEASIVDVRNDREVMVEGSITNGQGEITTTSNGIFALFTPESIRRLGLFDEEFVRSVESIIGIG